MKIYLAASYLRRTEIDELIAPTFITAGLEVCSRWHHTHHPKVGAAIAALEDIQDIDNCDYFVIQTEADGVYSTGGRHFETGYAWAWKKPIILVGPHEHVFSKGLMGFTRFDNYHHAIKFLKAQM